MQNVFTGITTDYAIIVPAFNEEAYLATTLLAIRAAMDEISATGELIVVDNNSSDNTAAVARANSVDHVVFEPHNQIARARNAGAAQAGADHLVFVDADTTITSEVLERALAFLESGSVVGGGARLVTDEPLSPMVAFLFRNWDRIAKRFQYAAGSFFFARRDAFAAVGGFDEAVYAGEEVWLARRLKRWGRKRGMGFIVIDDPPVLTSGRKTRWFTTWDFVKQLARIFLLPWSVRTRKGCEVWYRRPD